MERYYGFDLGDAESAVSVLVSEHAGKTDAMSAGISGAEIQRMQMVTEQQEEISAPRAGNGSEEPKVLRVGEEKSFITAYARTRNGDLIIGEQACYAPDALVRRIRFKSRYLTDKESTKDIKSFAAGVLGELYMSGDLVKGEDCCFYIGCPAGWDRTARERYRAIFEQVGYPPARIISESRAALVSACQSRHFQVGYDILSKPVLVVDMGSSTTDFAYIRSGREIALQTAGEVYLGGGIMDECLLELAVKDAGRKEEKIRKTFEASPAWYSYCEFAARRLKEKYFSDQEYWEKEGCRQSITIMYDRPLRFTLSMDADRADKILYGPVPQLDGKSFYEVFRKSLLEVREKIQGDLPDLVFLTGGVSKLPAVREWCQEIFPEAVVITGVEPEFSVCRGLAWSGRIDDELRQFRAEVRDLISSTEVERLVEGRIGDLYRNVVDAMVAPILSNVALPVFDRWKAGEILRLSDIDAEMERLISEYLHTEEAQKLMIRPITEWLRPLAYELEEYTMPICIRHGVPYKALSLTSFMKVSDLNIKVDAKDVFAVEELTWMIDGIISLMVGLVCGGSGIAMLSGGISGVVAGAMLSLMVLILGMDKMQDAMMNVNIPKPIRRLVPRSRFESRLGKLSAEVKANLYETLEQEKNTEITERMAQEISQQIEECLTKMAEVVEIPLG